MQVIFASRRIMDGQLSLSVAGLHIQVVVKLKLVYFKRTKLIPHRLKHEGGEAL